MANWGLTLFLGTRWSVVRPDAYYISKSGSDRSGDGSPRKPFATFEGAVAAVGAGQVFVFSSGTYLVGEVGNIAAYADGLVTLDGVGRSYLATNAQLTGFRVQNYVSLGQGGKFLTDCFVKNIGTSGGYNSAQEFRNCVFEDCFKNGVQYAIGSKHIFDHVTVIRSCWDWGGDLRIHRNCHYDVSVPSLIVADVDYFDYNNVQCLINGNATLAQFKASNPSRGQNCIALPPQFNGSGSSNYTLQATSPLRNLSIDGSYVGAYGVGVGFLGLDDAETLTNARWNNGTQQFEAIDAAQPMSVEYLTKDLNRVWALEASQLLGTEDNVDKQTIDATLSYENVAGVATDTPSGSILAGAGYWVSGYDSVSYDGRQYPADNFFYANGAVSTYDVVGTGKVVRLTEIPNIRLMELKYSSTSQGDCDSRNYKLFAVNRKPTYNIAGGRSNGDATFDVASEQPVVARWLKVRVTILPNSVG